MSMTSRWIVPILAGVLALAGCSATPAPEPVEPAESVESDAPPTAAECLTGPPWSLNLVDYADQALSYMQGLSIPVTELTMSGSQTVQFTEDGLMSVVTDITSDAVIDVPGVGPMPVTVHSTGGGSGDWVFDDETSMSIRNWSETAPESETGSDDIDIPVPDFSTIPSVTVNCMEGSLVLAAADAPLIALFNR